MCKTPSVKLQPIEQKRELQRGAEGAAPGNLGVLPCPSPAFHLACPGLASLWTLQGGPRDPA